MNIEQAAKQMAELTDDAEHDIYFSADGTVVTARHTGKFGPKDFAVGLRIPEKPHFKPTHIRLLIDLYLKQYSDSKKVVALRRLLERTFNGENVKELAIEARKLSFPMQFDSAETNLYYAQLLMVEQDFNFGPDSPKPSKMTPPRNYLMSFIRCAISGEMEIDKILYLAVTRKPCHKKYATAIDTDLLL